ncbi:MAG TPA: acyltransferase, partial [Pyrinomonadaceae bacterium]|nr:acyltransferase [Pyrinomonadaceae bacterium]
MNHAERIAPLDAMRGLAALGVLAFHFLWTNPSVPAGALKSLGYYGWLGVPVFFVISGLVIPHSLHRGGYRVSDYFIFVCKRLARLEPPYLASILVVVLVWCVYRLWPYVPHPSPFADPKGLVLHLGYLNAFFGRRWLNPVYWTLAIEFQYYVGVGLLYPLLAHTRRAARLAVMSLLASAVFLVPGDQFIFLHLPHFFVGTALFQHRAGLT